MGKANPFFDSTFSDMPVCWSRSTKLLFVWPGWYWDGWPFFGWANHLIV